jgi:hypothetical protein
MTPAEIDEAHGQCSQIRLGEPQIVHGLQASSTVNPHVLSTIYKDIGDVGSANIGR